MSDEENRGAGQGQRPVVRVQRRRRTEPPGPEGRERAEAPRRRERADGGQTVSPPSDTDSFGPPTTPVIPSGLSLPSLGGRSSCLLLALLALLLVCVVGALLLLRGPAGIGPVDVPYPAEPATYPTEPIALPTVSRAQPTESMVRPTEPRAVSPAASSAPAAATGLPSAAPTPASARGQTWLVMLYQDADDRILEKDIYVDLNEAERVGSSDRVQIVAQVDRFRGAFEGDGGWTSTRRFYVTQDDDLQRVGSQLVADLGELSMSDGNTLADFVTWAVQSYPADRQVLILSDHGMGWPGGWTDPDPGGRGDPNIPLASMAGDQLYLMELDEALATIRSRTGLDKFEMVGLDACLMGHLEVLSALAPHARYAVLSQEVEPTLGWAYTSFLEKLRQNPDMTGAELSRLVVGGYVEEDQRIVDDEARADLLRQGSPMGGLFSGFAPSSAAEVARQMGQDITLTAVDLSAVPALMESVNKLSMALQQGDQKEIARARTHTQSFTSIFGQEVLPSYIDLGHFVQLLKQTRAGQATDQAADGVLAALQRAVIAEKHGPAKAGATGVSIYFPVSQLFRSPMAGPSSYTAIARRFAEESLWDDFLAYHYTGREFAAAERVAAVPDAGLPVRGPGAGRIALSSIRLSDTATAPGRTVVLSIDVSGQNLGYLLFFTGFHDRASNSIFVADLDYLESSDTRQINGAYYPVWPEGEFTVEFEWEPLVFAISDGQSSATALLTPQIYGAAPEDAEYSVDGTYTYASGESRPARLLFGDGSLRQVIGFTAEFGASAPREIIPEAGDTFTLREMWLDLDPQGGVVRQAGQEGDTLTFGNQMFAWQELDAAPGDYVVGFVAQDLDGNSTEVYATLKVE